jgi:release factor glutamine methyltransferase
VSDIKNILTKYRNKIDPLDLELLIALAINKPREFILAHPEYQLMRNQELGIRNFVKRRMRGEPLAYILGQKEFYGLNFRANKSTLIPRPETELLVEEALNLLRSMLRNKLRNTTVVDVGTGSGNIIISIANALENFKFQISNFKFFGLDISTNALKIARQNAKIHKVNKKIKFLTGNLLDPLFKANKLTKLKVNQLLIVANLPYLSKSIYGSAPKSVRKFEPRSALLSGKSGLAHYEKLFKQIKLLVTGYGLRVTGFVEISPEQKIPIRRLASKRLPEAKVDFKKDLAGRWRICRMSLK